MRAALSALLLVAAVVAVAMAGGEEGAQQSVLASNPALDWSAFDQQLHNDWVKKAIANKHGQSSAQMRLKERKQEDERRMLAQKRLEVKKVAEEKEMEQLERNIELEASNQLAAHNTQLSDAIVQSAPQLQPQVVFEGHFQPGYDAKSAGEAAAELAAWGPTSNANWARVLSQQRRASTLAAEQQPYQQQLATYNMPQQRTAAMRVGPGSTGGDVLHEAWKAETQLHTLAKTQDLAAVKSAAMTAEADPADGAKENALTKMLAAYLTKNPVMSKAVEKQVKHEKKAKTVPAGHVAMKAALAGAPLPAAVTGATTEAAKVKELSLEAKLAHEQAQNAILKEKLKEEQLQAAESAMAKAVLQPKPAALPNLESRTAAADAIAASVDKEKAVASAMEAANFQKAARLPVVHAKSKTEQNKWAAVMMREHQMTAQPQQQVPALASSGRMRCCDDSCETISNHCNAPSPIPMQPAVTFGVASPVHAAAGQAAVATGHKAATALSGGAEGDVPKDATEKQLMHYLVSGTPAQKHQAAGLLYAETTTHEGYSGEPAAQLPAAKTVQAHQSLISPVKEVLVKGIRRCCDSSCNYVNTVCPNTEQLDHYSVELYAAGEGPSQSQLSNELMKGTQVQKDEAAAVFYAINNGLVAKEKKKLAKKAAAIKASEAPAPVPVTQEAQEDPSTVQSSGNGHPDSLMGAQGAANSGVMASVGGSHGHSQSALQAGQVVSEAESIVGDLAAEGH